MPKSKGRQRQRRKPSLRARETRVEQARAEELRTRSYASYRRRRIASWALIVAGIVVGVSHWLMHFDLIRLASPGIQDLLVGYPTATVLAVGGLMLLPPSWSRYRSKT